MLQNSLVIVSMAFYLLATATLLRRLFHVDGIDFKRVLQLSGAAMIPHALFIGLVVITPDGQDFSLINVISLVCLAISLSVSVATIKHPAPFLLSIIYGFSALIQLLTLFFPTHVMMQHVLTNWPLTSHIALSLLAYCVLIIATLYAIQFQYINTKLKSKDLSVVNCHFPPLMQVEKQQFRLLTIGTALLSLALLSGFVYLDNMFARTVAHKTILSMLAWTVYVILIIGHRFRGWRGKNAVWGTLTGAVLLTLAYFGSRFVREIILGRF